ncbi:MAG: hypothetical protein L0Y35_06070 [Flammeovirgaceae bacterium]|nr:hypothetical protein [Flammeovirgaceae bacterium]
MKIIDFKTSLYFSSAFIFLAIGLLPIGLVMFSKSVVVAFIIFLVCAIIFTTHYRFKIDLDSKTFHDYLWIMGLKFGNKGAFENIEYLFIKKSKESQTMNLRIASSTIQKEVYDGYLKLSDTEKIHLFTQGNKDKLIEKLKSIAVQLNVRIMDYSEGPPQEVSM